VRTPDPTATATAPPRSLGDAGRDLFLGGRCVGCGASAPKRDLLRFVARDGALVADPAQTAPGRGAYLHRDPACWERARRRGAFARALRAPAAPPPGLPAHLHLD
jgi:predicted RNA-binding protein YlxR (DUF448 family)